MKTLTASDRKSLIRLAASLPKGDKQRRAILAGLSKVSFDAETELEWWTQFREAAMSAMNIDKKRLGKSTRWSPPFANLSLRGEPKHKGVSEYVGMSQQYYGPDGSSDFDKFGVRLKIFTLDDPKFDPKVPGLLQVKWPPLVFDLEGSPDSVIRQVVGLVKKYVPPQAGLLPGQKYEPIVDPRIPSKDFQKQVQSAAQAIYNGFASRLPRTMSIPPGDKFKSFGWKWIDRDWLKETKANGDEFPVKASNLIKLKSPQIGYKFYVERADRKKGSPRSFYEISDANQKQVDSILDSVIKSNEALLDSLDLKVERYNRYPGAEIIFEVK